MSLTFQSLRSSSRGNCLLLKSSRTAVLIDCGIKTQRECHALLDGHASRLDAVLVSHAHGDHVCYSSLRVLERYGTPVHCHQDVLRHVSRKHVRDRDSPPQLNAFQSAVFSIGDFEVLPVALPHEPHCPTFGFVIRCGDLKIVVCTDFHDPGAIGDHLIDADFIFIEANHDTELLRLFPNYASHYHLNNRKTGKVLAQARRNSCRPPKGVMLGHLSEQRNNESLALDSVRDAFAAEKLTIDFKLDVAPRYAVSNEFHIV